jgi:hypothetical protein
MCSWFSWHAVLKVLLLPSPTLLLLLLQAKPYLVPGFTKGLPAELRQSYGAWIRANGLDPLLPAMYIIGSLQAQ